MSEAITYNATGKVTEELLRTLFQDAPKYEIEGGKKSKLISGITGILLTGGFNLGKTTDIIKMFEFKCMYQKRYKGIRQIHVGVLRNSNADFVDTLGKSFGYWYEEHTNKNFKHGFRIASQNTRPEITVRFPSLRYIATSDGGVEIKPEIDEDGNEIECEIKYFCYASNQKDDEKKMKGGEFTDTWSNEGNITTRAAHEMLTGRNDRFPPNGATRPIWVMDVNPTHKKSWEYIEYIQNPKKSIRVISYPSPIVFIKDEEGEYSLNGIVGRYEVNPEATIHGEYSYFFNQLTKSENFIKNNILGQYTNVVEGHVVHSSFDPNRHVKKTSIYANQVIGLCVDFGVKCGFVAITVDDDGVVSVVKDGWVDTGFRNLYNSKILAMGDNDKFKDQFEAKDVLFIGDPRTINKKDLINASTSVKLLVDDDFEYTVPRREDGVIVDNIDFRTDTVDEYLENDMIIIDPCCELTIDSFSFGYVKNEITGRPDKIKSGLHAEIMDALQYGLTYIKLGGYLETSDYYYDEDEIHHAY